MGDNHKSSNRPGTGRPQGGEQNLPDRPRWRRVFWARDRSKKRNAAVTTAWIGAFGAVSAAAIPAVVGSLDVTRSSATRSSHTEVATIIHTPRGEGIFAWSLPSMLGTSNRLKLYSEGQTIEVVCQIRDGQTVDDPGEGRPEYEVSVWDKLPNGGWISDLYTDLENKRGDDSPPSGVGVCHEGS